MSKSSLLALPLAAAMLFASYSLPVMAQSKTGADATRDDPADAAARVPPLVYRSSLATYQAFSEQEVKDWRESNDNVGRIGGWRAYAKEGRKPDEKPSGAAPAKPNSSTDAHQQHH